MLTFTVPSAPRVAEGPGTPSRSMLTPPSGLKNAFSGAVGFTTTCTYAGWLTVAGAPTTAALAVVAIGVLPGAFAANEIGAGGGSGDVSWFTMWVTRKSHEKFPPVMQERFPRPMPTSRAFSSNAMVGVRETSTRSITAQSVAGFRDGSGELSP